MSALPSIVQAAAYARTSTLDQNCEMQLRELREYAARRGWRITGEYVDSGWSGAKASRPELDRLMRDAAQHRFDAVLVWKLDRFGRSVLHLSQALAALDSHGIRFVAVSQGVDTDASNPTSRLLLNILSSVAEFEREMIRERVAAGVRNAKAKGKQIGRRRIILDRTKARELHLAGRSLREIAATLGVSRSIVHRALCPKLGLSQNHPSSSAA